MSFPCVGTITAANPSAFPSTKLRGTSIAVTCMSMVLKMPRDLPAHRVTCPISSTYPEETCPLHEAPARGKRLPRVHWFLRSSGLYASLGAHAGSSQDACRRVSLPTNRTFWPPSAIDFQLCVALRADTGLRGGVRAVLTFCAAQRSNRFRKRAHVCGKGCVSSGRAGAPAMPIQYTVLTVFICFTGIRGDGAQPP